MTDNTIDVTLTLDSLALLRQLHDRLAEAAGDEGEGEGGAQAKGSGPKGAPVAAELVSTQGQRLAQLFARIEAVIDRLDALAEEVGALGARVGNLDRRLDALSVGTPDSPLATLVARIEALERDMEIVDRQLAKRAGGPAGRGGLT